MVLANVALDDKYRLERGRAYLTGTQALVRLPMMQRQIDQRAGLKTAGFISGYRGSPLGGYDRALWEAQGFLAAHDIHFQPGVNEELAATAVWGSQQVNLFDGARYDGVFGLWYGKGPGVDRAGDAFKHANNAGTGRYGGVLAVAGDDHACKSSTLPHQSEYAFMDACIPVLNPSGVAEILAFGLAGWAMSRYSGCWVALKAIAETMDSSASVAIDLGGFQTATPDDFTFPPGGVHIRWPDKPLDQEYRLHRYKLYAALAFARANKLDRVALASARRRFGIVTVGKSYLDVMQALEDLGIDEALAAEIGLTIYKVGMSWPLERDGVRHFSEGLEEILVIEEKRAVIENQMKEQLYNWRADVRPRVIGKFDEDLDWILPSADELTPARIAQTIARRIGRFFDSPALRDRLAFLEAKEKQLAQTNFALQRVPTFCSGCPHNLSTKVPEGSRALAGIGCHYMTVWMDRRTATFSQMGGEGAAWIGQSPFTATPHVFVNLGDGTYFHSGALAIRAAIAAGVNVTYKLLYNDAVAMTGGQPVDGSLSVSRLAMQLAAEGVRKLVVVTDEPDKYPIGAHFPSGVEIEHRKALDRVQKELRRHPGVSVIIYDQTCATEKRRRRKRGRMIDPPRRVMINESVCEGCGDCGVQSNCVSIVPVETEFGRKRQIDQSTCNKDMSCVEGFCPSFVTVEGGKLRTPQPGVLAKASEPPAPAVHKLDRPYGILVTGVGGSGVVTVGALLGMAAHLEGKGCSVLDMTGLAQKGGAVFSHIRIARRPEELKAVRIAAGAADLVLGTDFLTAGSFDALAKMRRGRTVAVINSHPTMTSDFTLKPDLVFPAAALERSLNDAVGADRLSLIDATEIAAGLMGDAIAANLFLLGMAAQKGLLPVSAAAIEQAMTLNGVAVDFNRQAFLWGRRAAIDPQAVAQAACAAHRGLPAEHRRFSETLDEAIARRVAFLRQYQNAAYAERYRQRVERVRQAERARIGNASAVVTAAVARGLFKLMAYKDEYEVARLYTDGSFARQVADRFEGDYQLAFNLAPPWFARRDADTGALKKQRYGGWMMMAFKVLARLKRVRGSFFDPFGQTLERRTERELIREYEALADMLAQGMTPERLDLAVRLASVAEQIRGFGQVKERSARAARIEWLALLQEWRHAPHMPAKTPEEMLSA